MTLPDKHRTSKCPRPRFNALWGCQPGHSISQKDRYRDGVPSLIVVAVPSDRTVYLLCLSDNLPTTGMGEQLQEVSSHPYVIYVR